jgi:uncharacterized delta-60 repeat protein
MVRSACNLFRVAIACAAAAVAFNVSAQTPGSLDTSFGGTGSVVTPVSPSTGDDRASSMVVQPDGKIVVGGGCENDFCMVRYLPNGSLDSTFGSGGKVTQSLLGRDAAYALALQPDDKLVLVGACRLPASLDGQMCAARFTAAGALDTTFGAGVGWVSVNFTGVGDIARAVALQSDGRIVMAGGCGGLGNSTGEDFCLARLNASGLTDTTFGTAGKIVNTFGGGNVAQGAFAVVVETNRFIVVAGYCRVGSYDSFCVARYVANGSMLDNTFGSGTGVVTTQVAANVNTRAYGLAYQPDGKILVSGECGSVPCAVRYLSTGVLDASFAGGGIAGGSASFQSGGGGALALSFDGSFIVAGWSNPAAGINNRNVRRYAADAEGSGAGFTQVPIGFASSNPLGWRAVALQRDGKILVASSTFGAAGDDFVIARYHGFPSAARNCSMDVDGDGRVIATIDGLILTRAMLGFASSAAINGITFAPHAVRTTWSDIRDYLVSQCGMSIQ